MVQIELEPLLRLVQGYVSSHYPPALLDAGRQYNRSAMRFSGRERRVCCS